MSDDLAEMGASRPDPVGGQSTTKQSVNFQVSASLRALRTIPSASSSYR